MNKPSMVLFDYGHTLLHEPNFNGVRGMEAVLQYAIENPQNLNAEQVCRFSEDLFYGPCNVVRKAGMEIHNHNMQRLGYEYMGLYFSKSHQELEEIFWDHATAGELMPHVEQVIALLNKQGIRMAVISNIGFSGLTLKKRIDRLLPENRFEFFLASSDYMVRKPNPMLFELALRKAGITAQQAWFCGDSKRCDVMGASAVGIFPVWYDSPLECEYRDESKIDPPACEHLYIRDWLELLPVLERVCHA